MRDVVEDKVRVIVGEAHRVWNHVAAGRSFVGRKVFLAGSSSSPDIARYIHLPRGIILSR